MNIKTLSALVLAASASVVCAGDKMAFKDVDTNGDAFISMEEARNVEGLAEIFQEADVDKDGNLSEEEYSKIS